ncbi:MAG: DUF6512 family protein [Bacilli bacterium]|nr:DUF6512 family protein [Bacilli bacterium]
MTKSVFKSTIILFITGFFLHYAYDISNNNFLVGLFTPINESVFEHLKLAFYPILSWWLILYIFKEDIYNINKERWFTGCLVSIITSILTILSIYYIMKCGFELESIFIDILSLYVGLLTGQFLGYHIYKYYLKTNFVIVMILVLLIFISFIIFTIYPPNVLIFK